MFNSVSRLIRNLKKIRKLSVSDELKKRFRHAYIWSIYFKRYDAKNKAINIAGKQIKYCSFENFMHLFNEIILNQEYLFQTNVARPFIIDCGSNIGMSVLNFKLLYPNSEIIAFEPDELAFSCLKENIESNQFDNVEAHQKAITAQPGEIDFYYDEENLGSLLMSSIRERLPKSKRTVESVQLSTFIDRDVDFLKMDIEGAELEVIQEVQQAGKLKFVKQMAIEYHHHIYKDKDELSVLLKLLEDEGFGYLVESHIHRPFKQKEFQDVLIYAYQKD